jgi:dihydrofolate reductase
MPKVIADITMSLDGFVTGEGADEQHGLGDAPELHTWVMHQDAVDTEILEQSTARSGAVVMGRRLFDVVNGKDGWNQDMGYGADQTGTPPFFVVTHSPPGDVRLERELGMRFTFAGDLDSAIDRPRPMVMSSSWAAATSSVRRSNRVSSTSCAFTSPRWCSAAGRRCSKRGRAGCTGSAMFARRATRCTSRTNTCSAKVEGGRVSSLELL